MDCQASRESARFYRMRYGFSVTYGGSRAMDGTASERRTALMRSGPSQRQLRVGEQVRHALAEFFQRGELRDDALGTAVLSVSEVRMSPDLKVATAFVSPLGEAEADAVVDALNRHARFIRGRLSPQLRQMKYMPEFRFRLDTSFENFARIDRLLKSPEVARDLGHDEGEEE
jgi:ribosome-binding factor A